LFVFFVWSCQFVSICNTVKHISFAICNFSGHSKSNRIFTLRRSRCPHQQSVGFFLVVVVVGLSHAHMQANMHTHTHTFNDSLTHTHTLTAVMHSRHTYSIHQCLSSISRSHYVPKYLFLFTAAVCVSVFVLREMVLLWLRYAFLLLLLCLRYVMLVCCVGVCNCCAASSLTPCYLLMFFLL